MSNEFLTNTQQLTQNNYRMKDLFCMISEYIDLINIYNLEFEEIHENNELAQKAAAAWFKHENNARKQKLGIFREYFKYYYNRY